MNLDELNVFEGMSGETPSGEPIDNDFEDLECPLVSILGGMYLEPHPYGVTISADGTESLLEQIGYKIVSKDGERFALKDSEKLSRSKSKRKEQSLLEVYRRVSEELAIARFVKDWKNVFGTTGDSGQA